jgi:uncharacterized membrane protein YvbJ
MKVKCPKCGQRNDIEEGNCFYCENDLRKESQRIKNIKKEKLQNNEPGLIFKLSRFVFWAAVIVGGFYLLGTLVNNYNADKERELDEKLEEVCGVILDQQPRNFNLYDDCMEQGSEQFSAPVL